MSEFFFASALAEEAATTETTTTTEVATGTDTTTESTTASSTGSTLSFVIMMVAMVAIFYFLIIRPQRKKDKAVKDMLSALKPGDRICTIGGIYGTIASMKEDTVTLTVGSEQNTVVFARWAIRSVENKAVENDSEPAV